MHEQEATIQESEQRVLEKSLEPKSLEAKVADLEKDLASTRARHMEAEVARTAGAPSRAMAATAYPTQYLAQRPSMRAAAAGLFLGGTTFGTGGTGGGGNGGATGGAGAANTDGGGGTQGAPLNWRSGR
jgi:hypothetical protein